MISDAKCSDFDTNSDYPEYFVWGLLYVIISHTSKPIFCSSIDTNRQKQYGRFWYTRNCSWSSSSCLDRATYWRAVGMAYSMARVAQTLRSWEWDFCSMLWSGGKACSFVLQGFSLFPFSPPFFWVLAWFFLVCLESSVNSIQLDCTFAKCPDKVGF